MTTDDLADEAQKFRETGAPAHLTTKIQADFAERAGRQRTYWPAAALTTATLAVAIFASQLAMDPIQPTSAPQVTRVSTIPVSTPSQRPTARLSMAKIDVKVSMSTIRLGAAPSFAMKSPPKEKSSG